MRCSDRRKTGAMNNCALITVLFGMPHTVCGSQNKSEALQLINGLCIKTGVPGYDDNWQVVLPGDLRLGRFKCIQLQDAVLVVVSLLTYERSFDCSTIGTQCRKLLGAKEAVTSRTEIQEVVVAADLIWDEDNLQVYALGDLYGWETRAIGIGLGRSWHWLRFMQHSGKDLACHRSTLSKHCILQR